MKRSNYSLSNSNIKSFFSRNAIKFKYKHNDLISCEFYHLLSSEQS